MTSAGKSGFARPDRSTVALAALLAAVLFLFATSLLVGPAAIGFSGHSRPFSETN